MRTISFRELKPTKTNLINLQKRLNFAVRGKKFLEFKQEQLMSQIKNRYYEYQSVFNKFMNLYKNSLINLNKIYKEMGKRDLVLISSISKIQYKPSINLKHTKRIGIPSSEISYDLDRKDKLPAYSFENSSHFLDDLTFILENFFESLIKLAEKEDLFIKFVHYFNRITRRINGLKNIIIPRLIADIKKIREILEENDRENFVRLKKTKDLIQKKEISKV
ncbi:MAG: V-type ATP synthase subunit D [Candidatus Heimdallarchaeota archaeon]